MRDKEIRTLYSFIGTMITGAYGGVMSLSLSLPQLKSKKQKFTHTQKHVESNMYCVCVREREVKTNIEQPGTMN